LAAFQICMSSVSPQPVEPITSAGAPRAAAALARATDAAGVVKSTSTSQFAASCGPPSNQAPQAWPSVPGASKPTVAAASARPSSAAAIDRPIRPSAPAIPIRSGCVIPSSPRTPVAGATANLAERSVAALPLSQTSH